MALKDNPIPIGLDFDDDDERDDYTKYLDMTEAHRESLLAQYSKTIADGNIAVTKSEMIERNKDALEEANRLTRWNWDGDEG